ncbi:MAG: MFS transporter [Deltaproteobacteria bacterium]|nr:MFS transporter [Deltaproteobacteria bacterium]
MKKISTAIKAGYGAAEASSSIVFTLFYTFGMMFFTDVLKLSPGFAGALFAIGLLWDAFVDPAVGMISDRLKSKYGRRRPFIIAVALPLGLITWLHFTNFHLGPLATKIYFVCIVILYFTAYSVLETPHLALAAEMTKDYDERTGLLAWRAGWSQLGSVIAGPGALALIVYFQKLSGDKAMGWSLMAASLALISVPLIVISWRVTRGFELFAERADFKLKDIFSGPLKNKPFRYTIGLYTLSLVAVTISGGAGMYFMQYVMKFSQTQLSIALFIIVGVAILWIPLIEYVSAKIGKRGAWIVFVGAWALAHGIGIQFFARPEWPYLTYFLFLFTGAGFASVFLIGWSVISDCIEVDEFKTGFRREGLYFGVIFFIQKILCAAAMWSFGIVLHKVGYIADVAQKPAALMGIRTVSGISVAVLLVVSILFCIKMPMTRGRHRALLEAIKLKNEGKTYDDKEIEALL